MTDPQGTALGVECAWPFEHAAAADRRPPHQDAPVIAEPEAAVNTMRLEAADDWDQLYRAVLGRLAAAAQASPAAVAPHLRVAAGVRLGAVLHDCVQALARLVEASQHDRRSHR